MNSAEKESTALPETEQLIKFLDEHIRKIVREEINRSAWETFKSLHPPEFVKGLEEALQKRFPYLKSDLRE